MGAGSSCSIFNNTRAAVDVWTFCLSETKFDNHRGRHCKINVGRTASVMSQEEHPRGLHVRVRRVLLGVFDCDDRSQLPVQSTLVNQAVYIA